VGRMVTERRTRVKPPSVKVLSFDMSAAAPLLVLLAAAATFRRDLRLSSFPASAVEGALEGGLGALLEWCVSGDPQASQSRLWPTVRGAALTARVLAEESHEALLGVLEACAGLGVEATLLKGVSIAHQHYPLPHLRPMRDLDVLVEPEAVERVEAVLRAAGYEPVPGHLAPEFYAGHQHGVPLVHPRTGVWVEIHRRLFRADGPMGAFAAFAPERVRAERRHADYHGRPVFRLSDELQVLYVSTHWALSFGVTGAEGGLVALLDALYLLRAPLDWDRVLSLAEGSAVATHLELLLGYLERRGLTTLPAPVRRRLARPPHGLGRGPEAVLHRLIDRYLMAGRPFGRLLPLHRFERIWESLLAPGRPAGRLWRAALGALPSPRRLWAGDPDVAPAQPPAETREGRSTS
jgi:hypothetical protein